MKAEQIKLTQSVLSKELGRTWPWFLAGCLLTKRKIFRNTHWATSPGEESEFVRRLAIIPAVYAKLRNKIGKERAYEVSEKIFFPMVLNEQLNLLSTLNLSGTDGMEHFRAFRDLFENRGVGRLNRREYIFHDDDKYHFITTRCVFYDFFSEVGYPELTGIFCKVDGEFYTRAFSTIRFHRGDSWENTMVCGKTHCDFIVERSDIK